MTDYELNRFIKSKWRWYDWFLFYSWMPFVLLFPVMLLKLAITEQEPGKTEAVLLIITCSFTIFSRIIYSMRSKAWEDEYYSTYRNKEK